MVLLVVQRSMMPRLEICLRSRHRWNFPAVSLARGGLSSVSFGYSWLVIQNCLCRLVSPGFEDFSASSLTVPLVVVKWKMLWLSHYLVPSSRTLVYAQQKSSVSTKRKTTGLGLISKTKMKGFWESFNALSISMFRLSNTRCTTRTHYRFLKRVRRQNDCFSPHVARASFNHLACNHEYYRQSKLDRHRKPYGSWGDPKFRKSSLNQCNNKYVQVRSVSSWLPEVMQDFSIWGEVVWYSRLSTLKERYPTGLVLPSWMPCYEQPWYP